MLGYSSMKRSTKAALLSALVFPGAGHMFLKKYLAGALIIGTSIAAVYYLLSKSLEMASQITEELQRGNIQLDIETITELVSKQSTAADVQLLNIATAAFFICWLIGIIDSYRIGRTQDKIIEHGDT
jgi:uncharacterized membrane protein